MRRPPARSADRSAILAASNFLTFSGMLAASIGYWLRVPTGDAEPLFSSRQIFMLCGLATIPVFIYIIFLIPQASIKFFAWLTTHSIYRIRVHGGENMPQQGGGDPRPEPHLMARRPTPFDYVISSGSRCSSTGDCSPIGGARPARTSWARFRRPPKAARLAIETAREALQNGELVCIFPEGGISRSGQLQSFKSGVLEIRKGTDAPLIPRLSSTNFGAASSASAAASFFGSGRRTCRAACPSGSVVR